MSTAVKLKLGTRGSDLARTQSGTVARSSSGSASTWSSRSFARPATGRRLSRSPRSDRKACSCARSSRRCAAGDVDLAVHSFKDLPTQSPAELVIGAVPERVDPADLLLAHRDALTGGTEGWLGLKHGARVGTASARRRVWLKHYRPDLAVEALRGNVPTRLKKLQTRAFDAILLAAAGVDRLRAEGRLDTDLPGIQIIRLDPNASCPRPRKARSRCNAAARTNASATRCAALDHAASHAAVDAERDGCSPCAEGGCDIAFGAHCRDDGDGRVLIAMLERDGVVRTARVRGDEPQALGRAAWMELSTGTARP